MKDDSAPKIGIAATVNPDMFEVMKEKKKEYDHALYPLLVLLT